MFTSKEHAHAVIGAQMAEHCTNLLIDNLAQAKIALQERDAKIAALEKELADLKPKEPPKEA